MAFFVEWRDGALTRLRATDHGEAEIEAAEEGFDREYDFDGVVELPDDEEGS